MGHKKATSLVQRFGSEVVAVNVIRRTGTNVLQVMSRLQAAMTELNNGVLADRNLQLNQVYDETEYIHDSINLVWENIWQGGLLTLLILLLFFTQCSLDNRRVCVDHGQYHWHVSDDATPGPYTECS